MSAVLPEIRLAPEDENDELIVSKKGFAELKRRAEAQERENERLRGEGERQLHPDRSGRTPSKFDPALPGRTN